MNLNHQCPNCEILHEKNCVPSDDGKNDSFCSECIKKGYIKYFISWLDSYNTWNHTDLEKVNGRFALNKNGLKNIKELYPIYEIEGWDCDGWVDCSHLVIVWAKNREELNKEVQRVFEENGRIVDVFSVINEDKTINLTEEDF